MHCMGVPLSEVVDQFLIDRATLTRRGLTESSRENYRRDIVVWATVIARQTGRLGDKPAPDDPAPLTVVLVDDLTETQIKNAYRVIRLQEAVSTTQRRVGTLRLLCHWLQLEGHLGVDPTLRIEAPERPVRLPAGWNDDELERLADAVWEERAPHARRWPALERATFALLSTTGVRAAELCAVSEQSLRRDSGGEVVMSVIGKGNRQRIVPVPPEAITFVEEYLRERTARFGTFPAASPLLRRADGVPLTRGALRHLVDGWIARSGVPKQEGESAHGFRHTYAKGLIRSGVPAPAVQALLGHEDLKTTGIYVKATAADVRDAALLSPARQVLRDRTP
ncbi:tyrosine recombinase XerC [Cellulomonas terrae]|uniref:Tyrosine recombinase XerC n=2 Tax=Cellulomonas terrae TaxID=311234 RepID=A0A511JH02_9CELL|nr:tyrosine recombinase XerC [Cellulomonas terrae]